jgi:beta-aspartyl-peptidase (threonine type)
VTPIRLGRSRVIKCPPLGSASRLGGLPARPVIAVHAGAGPVSPEPALREEARSALITALDRGRAALRDGGGALDAVSAAVAYMEDEVEFFNAGRGAVLCADGSAELSAAVMRGGDRSAGAVALLTRTRSAVAAARAVMEGSPHVLLAGPAADRFAAARGLEGCEPDYFISDRQRARLADRGSDFAPGTVGAVCLDGSGALAAATSTGGRRGQLPGRIGDTPTIGAGTWADERVAVSCTGDGESFVRAAAAHALAMRVADDVSLADAADHALAEVRRCDGTGGLICVDVAGKVALPFTSGAMNRGVWREGADPRAWV